MLLSLQERIWRTAATLTLTYFVGWGLGSDSGKCFGLNPTTVSLTLGVSIY